MISKWELITFVESCTCRIKCAKNFHLQLGQNLSVAIVRKFYRYSVPIQHIFQLLVLYSTTNYNSIVIQIALLKMNVLLEYYTGKFIITS